MKHAPRCSLLGAALVAAASACSQPSTTVVAAPSTAATSPPADAAPARAGRPANPATGKVASAPDVFAEPAPGIAVRAVPGTQVAHDFKRSYLSQDGWALYAAAGSTGTPLVALVVEGSNEVTSAEMRIGRSTATADIATCAALPAEATGAAATAEVGGVRFTRFSASDAAMSHYQSVESYRTVHDGACYAIDLIIAGTRPEVYDPPRTPPFSGDAAQQRLADALAAVHWTR